MRELMDRVDVASGPEGTEIRLCHRVGREAITTGQAPAPSSTPVHDTHLRVEVTHLVDDIDLSNAEKLYREMLDEMGRDAVGLIVDLSEVRHLDSAGIRMLHKLADRFAQRRLELRVVVPKVSSVRRVLELSCVDAHRPVTDTVGAARSEIDCARGGLRLTDSVAE